MITIQQIFKLILGWLKRFQRPTPETTFQPPETLTDAQPQTPAIPSPQEVEPLNPEPVVTAPPPGWVPIAQQESEPLGQVPAPVHRKVLMLIFNPRVPSEGNAPLIDVLDFKDPVVLAQGLIEDVREASFGYANFEIVDRREINELPRKNDGFTYTPESYIDCYRHMGGFHKPDEVDYFQIIKEQRIIEEVRSGTIDEVWMFAPPFSGFYESTMMGPDSFFCNAPPLQVANDTQRRVILMGFNYERGVGEMLEAMGHRAEDCIKAAYRRRFGNLNLWERYTRIDMTHPGEAEMGTVHYAPNSLHAYEWGSHREVQSRCDNWNAFPKMDGEPRMVDCREWGDGDIRRHHLWWFSHFPHQTGQVSGISANWWKYVVDPNLVK
jgi:hypothetical protein